MATRAAGLLVFRRLSDQIQYLLMQTSYGTHHWTPPKGHVDPGENDEETAFRETREEAGLHTEHLTVFHDFKKTLVYNVKGKSKTVIYWLAELKDPYTPIIMSEEHQDYKWLEVNDACNYAAYADTQQLLQEAETFLRSKFE